MKSSSNSRPKIRQVLLIFALSLSGACCFAQRKGSILILQAENNFAAYTGEILKTEGFIDFTVAGINTFAAYPASLQAFPIVILPKSELTPKQLTILRTYVNKGGHLIVCGPPPGLYPILGLKAAAGNGEDYLKIHQVHPIGNGLINQPLQLHAKGTNVSLTTAKLLASFTDKRGINKGGPAATINQFGKGEAVAILYDLPASILFTRQGNPALAGQETDGIHGIRAMDLFTGGWVNPEQNTLNHADEQMRFLSRCVEWMSRKSMPLPRLWYFPNKLNSLIALSNDGENSPEKDFVQQFQEVSVQGVGMTLYILEPAKISRHFVDSLQNAGHEMAAHPDATEHAATPTWQIVDSAIGAKFTELKSLYGIDHIATNTNHWFVWCGTDKNGKPDLAAGAKLEALHGIGMDVNYAHYDNNSNQGHFLGSTGRMQGNYTGSGLPMKFADEKGDLIDVYQLFNNTYDQQYMEARDKDGYYESFRGILDRSLDSGIYSIACLRAHNNEYFFSREPLLKILDYANKRKIPVWTVKRVLEFERARAEVRITRPVWAKNVLRFSLNSAQSIQDSLTCMIPFDHGDLSVTEIESDGLRQSFFVQKIKGRSFAMFNVGSGSTHHFTARYEKLLAGHKLVLDHNGKILPWNGPPSHAFDQFIKKRWNFIFDLDKKLRAGYPDYYFYCAYDVDGDSLKPNKWMNDVGEKLPNWFESARLYYNYTGDSAAMKIVREMAEYQLSHGVSPANFEWPNFPFANANAGDTIFNGFTSANRFKKYETQVDHSGEIGLTYLNLYLFYGDKKYLAAAIAVADVLAKHIRKPSKDRSPWPYLVNTETGASRSAYGANWTGCYFLLKKLAELNQGSPELYLQVCDTVRRFLQQYPLQTGYWTDGHSDTYINSSTYKSNLSASNYKLFLFDHPELDPNWKQSIPKLISWTEKNFVDRSAPGEKGRQWGANIVGEQDSFLFKMDYQTARYAAECARWFAISGDRTYKEKAFRALCFVTYCSDARGLATESPLSEGIASWWSDCYGEGPRMFYHAFSAIPEWTPEKENHILYGATVLREVVYGDNKVRYVALENHGAEYLRLNFKPKSISINNTLLKPGGNPDKEGFQLKPLGNGDFYLRVFRIHGGSVEIK